MARQAWKEFWMNTLRVSLMTFVKQRLCNGEDIRQVEGDGSQTWGEHKKQWHQLSVKFLSYIKDKISTEKGRDFQPHVLKSEFFYFKENVCGCIYTKVSRKWSNHFRSSTCHYCWCLIPYWYISFLAVFKI